MRRAEVMLYVFLAILMAGMMVRAFSHVWGVVEGR